MIPLPLKDIWVRFKAAKDSSARDEIISRYAYLVNITVGRIVANFPPNLDREDLISAGTMGLIKAVDQFDLGREVKFETYGIALIRGAVLEMLREQDWVPRSIRDRVKLIDRAMAALEVDLGRPATDFEIADALGVTLDHYHQMLSETGRTSLISLDEILVGGDDGDGVHLSDALADHNADTMRSVETEERYRRLIQAVDALPPRERMVVALYYRDGLTFKEIGRVLQVSESRAYQLHGQAVNRMRKNLVPDYALFEG
ncbi:MAG TPA: FliA/WhiG family RNA polymerase sigma factor [Armatimonadota bacterium]|jgi:RNA polymerase sigma factor for flagellar operon FliA